MSVIEDGSSGNGFTLTSSNATATSFVFSNSSDGNTWHFFIGGSANSAGTHSLGFEDVVSGKTPLFLDGASGQSTFGGNIVVIDTSGFALQLQSNSTSGTTIYLEPSPAGSHTIQIVQYPHNSGGAPDMFFIFDATISSVILGCDAPGVHTYTDNNFSAKSLRGSAVAFASRPATPIEGMMLAFTDSTTNVWGATITGGGANHVLGYYNGTNWTVAAK